MRPKHRNIYWTAAALMIALLLLLCVAQAEGDITVSAEMGYENSVSYLAAMPLRVRIRNNGGDAELTVAVNLTRSQLEYDRCEYPVFLAGGAEKTLTLPVRITFKQPSYTVEVLRDGEEAAFAEITPQKVLSPDTLLVGLLSDSPQSLRYLNINASNDQLMRGETWQTLALDGASFPEDVDMLRAFRILAVDGFDIGTLSTAQQTALRQWVREGGIVLVGGGSAAAATLRGFMPLTGVSALAPIQAQRVDTALTDALANGAFALKNKNRITGPLIVSPLTGVREAVATLNGQTLIDRCPVGQGVVYTCAFSLGERPLSAWNGMAGYWQRLLLTRDQSLYQGIISKLQNYYDSFNNGMQYADQWLLRQLPLENTDRVWLIVLLTATFAVLCGVGSYLLLKRLDKREWMWLTVPVLSLACAALTLTASGRMQLLKPASAGYALVTVDENARSKTSVIAGVAAAGNAPLCVSAGAGETLRPSEDTFSYYMDDDEEAAKAQPKLRYVYTYGDSMTVTLPAAASWNVQTMQVTMADTPDYPISGSVWWEEDGLHGEIVNASAITLDAGYVFTNQGYAPVPELQPGGRAAFAIVENPDRETDPDEVKVYPGELISRSGQDIYTIVYAALDGQENGQATKSASVKRSLVETSRGAWPQYAVFRYVTFSDQVPQPALAVNGETVERRAFDAVIDVKLAYQPVSATGIVRLEKGLIPVYSCQVDADLAPHADAQRLPDYTGYPLRDEPAFCFALGEVSGLDLNAVDIENVTVVAESYGASPHLMLYDSASGDWRDAGASGFPARIDGETARGCLDAAGRLYLRVLPGSGGANSEIYNLSMTLEGRAR